MVAYLDSSVLLRHILLGDSGFEHVFSVGMVISLALIFKEARQEETLLIFSYDAGMNRCAKALGFSAPFA